MCRAPGANSGDAPELALLESSEGCECACGATSSNANTTADQQSQLRAGYEADHECDGLTCRHEDCLLCWAPRIRRICGRAEKPHTSCNLENAELSWTPPHPLAFFANNRCSQLKIYKNIFNCRLKSEKQWNFVDPSLYRGLVCQKSGSGRSDHGPEENNSAFVAMAMRAWIHSWRKVL